MQTYLASLGVSIASFGVISLLGTLRFIQCNKYKNHINQANFPNNIAREIKSQYKASTSLNNIFFTMSSSVLAIGAIAFLALGIYNTQIINDENINLAIGLFSASSTPCLATLTGIFFKQKYAKDEALSQVIAEPTSASL